MAMRQLGISAVCVHKGTRPNQRREAVRAFRNGDVRALVNVTIMTTGFDAPAVDCIVLLRPTLSSGLYVQMLGRGMRTADGKADCLVLDFAGNIDRHGPLTEIIPQMMRPLAPQSVGAERKCPTCEAKVVPFTKQCSDCGHLFATITSTPSTASVMLPPEVLPRGAKKTYVAVLPDEKSELLSTEEVAGLIGTTPQYVKQMRSLGTGPRFSKTGGWTHLGFRQVVYHRAQVEDWQTTLTVFEGHENGAGKDRKWRFTPAGRASALASNRNRKKKVVERISP